MPTEDPDPAMRASDAERDAAVERLRVAAGEGRLTLEELADRIEAAGSARTHGELEVVVRDLPALPPPRDLATRTSHVTVLGDLRRSGRWRVPARSRWTTIIGDVVLDLRQAEVVSSEVEIEAKTVLGDVVLLGPEGVEVEIRGSTLLGDTKQDTGHIGAPGAPRVVLTARTVIGDVRVRSKRLGERLVERFRRS